MKRRTVHLGFGLVALGFAALAGLQAWQWQVAQRLNHGLATGAADAPGDEARLARALRLAGAGSYDAALAAYQEVARGPRVDLVRLAQSDMGNLHLRAALKDGAANAFKAVTLVELAKQNYRAVLRAAPDDWDLRYNLERALALAPEVEQPAVVDNEAPTPKERAASTLPGTLSDLP
jgi:mxaK protein